MRFFLLFVCLFVPLHTLAKPLNYDNLLLLTFDKNVLSDELLDAYLLQTDPAEHRKLNRKNREEKRAKHYKALKKQVLKDKKRLEAEGFQLEVTQQFVKYDESRNVAIYADAFSRYHKYFVSGGVGNKKIPRILNTFWLNPEAGALEIPFESKAAFDKWMEIREIQFSKRVSRSVIVQYSLKPTYKIDDNSWMLEISQKAAFVEVYKKKNKIEVSRYKKDASTHSIDQHPYRNGLRSPLVPIHSLMVRGFSLGEPMPFFKDPDTCESKKDIKTYLVYVCRLEINKRLGERAELVYVGGKLAKMTFSMPYETERASNIDRRLRKKFAFTGSQGEGETWVKGRAKVKSYSFPSDKLSEFTYVTAHHNRIESWLGDAIDQLP